MARAWRSWIAVVAGFAGCAPNAEPTPGQRFEAIASGAEAVMAECPERVWPGYDWADKQLVFYERSTRSARYVRLPAGSMRTERGELAYDALPEASLFGSFAIEPLDERPTVFVALDDLRAGERARRLAGIDLGLDAALQLAFHEAFHGFGQVGWPEPELPGGPIGERASDFPLSWQARYLRLQLLRSLQAALRGEGSLGAAAYWNDRYHADHGDEAASVIGLDVAEGSAEYVEVVSAWLAREGCALTEAELQKIAGAEIDIVAPYLLRKSGESYGLGAAAGLLLRAGDVPGWQTRVANGEPPVEILLEGVSAEPQPDDQERIDRVAGAIAEENAELSAAIAPFLAASEAPDAVRLALPVEWLAGSFFTGEPLRLVEVEGAPIVYPDFHATFVGDDGQQIVLEGSTVLDATTSTAICGLALGVVLAGSSATLEADGTYLVSAAGITASPLHATPREADGVQWLCLGTEGP